MAMGPAYSSISVTGPTFTRLTSPPPLLGENTAEVLTELGRTPEQITDLAARGAIGLPAGGGGA
jgi:crotonobetainyl-CoA:carnitine CoA-transferase CaiB-like acyl-CoA transferase